LTDLGTNGVPNSPSQRHSGSRVRSASIAALGSVPCPQNRYGSFRPASSCETDS
jgi:hypothetical protein